MSNLEQAIALAARAHAGQTDKAGAPYILHPLRVMLRLDGEQERIAGVLHDVLEDCELSAEDLRGAGFGEEVLAALDAVTRRDGESYESFVRRAAEHPIGARVKLADLEDNADLGRIAHPTERDHARRAKYLAAMQSIRKALGEG